MPTVIDSLLVRLGYSVDAKNLEGFAALTEKAKGAMLGLGAAVSGAFFGISKLVEGAAERLGDVQNFAEQMDMSARSVAALGEVASDNDSSLEAMEGSLRSLSSMAGQAAMGIGRGKMLFDAFGLAARDSNGNIKTTEEILGDVADKLQNMPSINQRNALGARLGFDGATIKLLSEGRENFMRLRAEALKGIPFTDNDYELADQTDKAYRNAGGAVMLLKNRLAVSLMPTVNDLLKRFTAWTKEEGNVQKMKDAVQKVADVCVLLANNLSKVAAGLSVAVAWKAGTYFLDLGTKVMSAFKAMGSLNFALGGLRTILTGGLMGLILLVAEDLYTFGQGGESVTGWMLEKFPYAVDVMKQALVGLGSAFAALTLRSGPIGLVALGIGELILLIDQMNQANQGMSQSWADFWDGIFDSIARVVNQVASFLRMLGADVGDMATGVFGKNLISRKAIEGFSAKDKKFEGYETGWNNLQPDFLLTKDQRTAFAPAGRSVGNSYTTIGPTTFHIDGAKDPQAVSKAVGAELDKRQARGEAADSARARTRNAQGATAL